MKNKLLFVLLLFFAVQAYAGITVTEKLAGEQSVSYFQNGLIISYSGGKPDTLIDINKKTIYTVDYESEIIMYGTFDDMKEMQMLVSGQIQSITQDDFYKEQTDNVKKLNVKVESKGQAKYAGYSCDKVVFSIPELNISTELCYSKQLLDEISKEVNLAAFLDIINSNPMFLVNSEELIETEVAKYASKGFTLFEKRYLPDYNGAAKTEVTEVISVTKGKIPAEKFELPKGLIHVKIKDLMSGILQQ